jgi:thioesterase domain-containing protein
VTALFERATVADLARELPIAQPTRAGELVAIRTEGTASPFFCVHGLWGDVFHFRRVAQNLGADVPVYGFRMRRLEDDETIEPTSVEQLARQYVDDLVVFDPVGPYFLGGYSFGGLVAFEMACRLAAAGRSVALLALIDTINPALTKPEASLRYARFLWRNAGRRARQLFDPARRRRLPQRATPPPMRAIEERIEPAGRRYVPPVYPGRLTLLRTRENMEKSGAAELGWASRARDGVEAIDVAGQHMQLLEPPYVEHLGAALQAAITRARQR